MSKNSQRDKKIDWFFVLLIPMTIIVLLIGNDFLILQNASIKEKSIENNIQIMRKILESEEEISLTSERKFETHLKDTEDSIDYIRSSPTIVMENSDIKTLIFYQEQLTLLKLKKFEKIMQNKKTQSNVMKIK